MCDRVCKASIDDLPAYADLMLPTLQAVDRLGGSASVRQIRGSILDELQPPEEWLAVTYPGRDDGKGVYLDRLDWARSYCKLGGALDSPKRGLFLITELGTDHPDMLAYFSGDLTFSELDQVSIDIRSDIAEHRSVVIDLRTESAPIS